jgi:hypothetical protein
MLHDVSKFEGSVFFSKQIDEQIDQLHRQGSCGGMAM